MKPKTPAIAVRRRHASLKAYRRKLSVFESLLKDGTLAVFPERASIAAFASWEDPQLGLVKLSRSTIYSNEDEYLVLRRQLEHFLQQIKKRRARGPRRENAEEVLRQRLAEAEAQAQSYVNQYSAMRSELLIVQAENVRLREKIKRLSNSRNVFPLRVVDVQGTGGRGKDE